MFLRNTDCNISQVYNSIFDPEVKCCLCGGGQEMSQELYQSIPENEFKCRTSDYRSVASDPNYNVIDVKAVQGELEGSNHHEDSTASHSFIMLSIG